VRELRDTLALEADADIGAESTTANTGDGDESTQPPSQTAGRSRWSGRSDTDANEYPWADRTAVMGILNVTPDSFFHDGGEYDALEDAVARAEAMIDADVDVIDIGGESTRPGAAPVSVEEELDRVVPVIERIADLDAHISVDTRRATVADAALEAGADIINDVSGLEDPEMRFVAAEHDAGLVVMHSIDAPVVPDHDIEYDDDVVADVIDHLRAGVAGREGGARSSADHRRSRHRFRQVRCRELRTPRPDRRVPRARLSGVVRPLPQVHVRTDRPRPRRAPLEATVAATALASDRGADIVRVHDVRENVAAVRTTLATRAIRSDSSGTRNRRAASRIRPPSSSTGEVCESRYREPGSSPDSRFPGPTQSSPAISTSSTYSSGPQPSDRCGQCRQCSPGVVSANDGSSTVSSVSRTASHGGIGGLEEVHAGTVVSVEVADVHVARCRDRFVEPVLAGPTVERQLNGVVGRDPLGGGLVIEDGEAAVGQPPDRVDVADHVTRHAGDVLEREGEFRGQRFPLGDRPIEFQGHPPRSSGRRTRGRPRDARAGSVR